MLTTQQIADTTGLTVEQVEALASSATKNGK
jgi:hypothetical protein